MFSRLFLIGSFSYLQVMRTYIKAYTSLNFGQLPQLTTELAALERLKNRCHHVISVDIDPIFFKLAGNKNMHNIMNEFEFRPERTTDYGVSCPWASKKYPYRPYNGENGVSTFSLLFLIGSFWYFHVTRTSIKAWMSLNFLKWDLTLAHWTQVSDHCPLGYLFLYSAIRPRREFAVQSSVQAGSPNSRSRKSVCLYCNTPRENFMQFGKPWSSDL